MDELIKDTKDLRLKLLQVYQDCERGQITNAAARARAYVAREILDTVKVEIMASRLGVTSFKPVRLDGDDPKTIEGTIEKKE